jgi:RNA polymerase sigma factor (sigma-70 family)
MGEQHESCAGGDRGAEVRWSALAALRDDAVQVVRRRLARPEDAEDLVHEAMLRLAQRPTLSTEELPQLRSLLVRAACCMGIDRQRRSGRQQLLLGRLIGGRQASSAEEIVADRSEARWLAAGMEELGAMEHDALLYAMEGRRPGEIASLLGVEYKAAENALGRARRKLRLRAASVAVGLAALLRRFRFDEHSVALTASALAALILLSPGGSRDAPVQQSPEPVVHLPPALVLPVSHQVAAPPPPPAAPAAPAAPAPPATKVAAPRPAPPPPPAPAPPPPSPPPVLPPVTPPWQGGRGIVLVGRPGISLPPGSPGGWLIYGAGHPSQLIT